MKIKATLLATVILASLSTSMAFAGVNVVAVETPNVEETADAISNYVEGADGVIDGITVADTTSTLHVAIPNEALEGFTSMMETSYHVSTTSLNKTKQTDTALLEEKVAVLTAQKNLYVKSLKTTINSGQCAEYVALVDELQEAQDALDKAEYDNSMLKFDIAISMTQKTKVPTGFEIGIGLYVLIAIVIGVCIFIGSQRPMHMRQKYMDAIKPINTDEPQEKIKVTDMKEGDEEDDN